MVRHRWLSVVFNGDSMDALFDPEVVTRETIWRVLLDMMQRYERPAWLPFAPAPIRPPEVRDNPIAREACEAVAQRLGGRYCYTFTDRILPALKRAQAQGMTQSRLDFFESFIECPSVALLLSAFLGASSLSSSSRWNDSMAFTSHSSSIMPSMSQMPAHLGLSMETRRFTNSFVPQICRLSCIVSVQIHDAAQLDKGCCQTCLAGWPGRKARTHLLCTESSWCSIDRKYGVAMFRYVSYCLLACLMTSCAIDIPDSPGPFPADTTVMTDPIDGSYEADGGISVEFDSFVSDSMPRDVQASDAAEMDAAPSVCGDGILSGDERM